MSPTPFLLVPYCSLHPTASTKLFVVYSGAVLLERVEDMVSLGMRVSLGVRVTQWHGRLIVAVLDTSVNVTLHAVSPGTLEVSDTSSH